MNKGKGSVYLAGPIDYADLGKHNEWRDVARMELGEFCLYDPEKAFRGSPLADPFVLRAVNMAAVGACSGMLAAVFPDVPSWGTPIEIDVAMRVGKPIALWSPTGEVPPYLDSLPVFKEILDACRFLRHMVEIGGEKTTLLENLLRELDPDLAWEEERGLLATCQAIDEPKLKGDVGYDLHLLSDHLIDPGEYVKLPLGIPGEEGLDDPDPLPLALRIAIPDWMWGTFCARSSLAAKGLLVQQTVIDPGYRGPLYVFAHYVGKKSLELRAGSRIAQLVLFDSVTPPLTVVDELPDSERGANGFGSTGT